MIPAFPTFDAGESGGLIPTSDGMTLRDWFAGKAMSGMLSCQDFMNELIHSSPARCAEARSLLSDWAFKQADAMLAQRSAESRLAIAAPALYEACKGILRLRASASSDEAFAAVRRAVALVEGGPSS